jgi:hypothetical protein
MAGSSAGLVSTRARRERGDLDAARAASATAIAAAAVLVQRRPRRKHDSISRMPQTYTGNLHRQDADE